MIFGRHFAANSYLRTPICWLGYFILLLCIAMPHGAKTEYPTMPLSGPLRPTSTLTDVRKAYYDTDIDASAYRAMTIVQTHDWGHLSMWPMWPPGMVTVESILYWLSPNMPVILVLVLIANALWAAIFVQAMRLMQPQSRLISSLIAFFLPLTLMFTPVFPDITAINVIRSEALATPTFILGMGFLYSAVWHRKYTLAAMGGVLLALSAYVRALTDIIMYAMLLIFLLSAVLRGFRLKNAPCWFVAIGVCLLAYHACTLPYRMAHNMQWIASTNSNEWEAIWSTPEMLKSDPTRDLRLVGGVGGCIVDAERCAAIHSGNGHHPPEDYLRLTLSSFVHHPLGWLAYKLPFYWEMWNFNHTPEPVMEALWLPLLLLYFLKRRKEDRYAVLGICLCAGTLGTFVPLLFAHVEGRYMFQLQFLIMHCALIVIGGIAVGSRWIRSGADPLHNGPKQEDGNAQ